MEKEEIKHFKSLLRQGSIRHMNILLDDKFQKELQTIIKNYEKLQRENEELKKQYCERTDCSGRIGNSKKVEELSKKIDKAIEYINSSDISIDIRKTDGSLDYVSINELLNILRGGSK